MTPRRPRRSVAAVALASLCLLVVPTLALGHAELDTANPADKSTVPPPSEVVMTFTEALDPSASSIKLADAGGAIVAQGSTVDSTNTKTMRLELAELAPGNYSVRWTTKSTEDGDIARGTTTFTVIAPTPGKTLTLTTRHPKGSARQRLVVKADLVSETANQPAPA